jgi:hypothetical protein
MVTRFPISIISLTNWPIVQPQISKGAKQKVEKPDKFAAKVWLILYRKS